MNAILEKAISQNRMYKEGMPLGIYLDMPEAEYHAIKAFSYSGSKEFAKSPEHFKEYLSREWEVDPDREKFKAVHLLCLEPEKQKRLVVRDGVWGGSLKAEVIQLQKSGHIVLKSKDLEAAKTIAEKIKAHGLAGSVLGSKNTYTEVSIFWLCKRSGVYCKGRIDGLTVDEDGLSLGDLKNFGDISSEHILWDSITKKKYHWQMAQYEDGLFNIFNMNAVKYWIFVEDKAPHGIKVRTCTDAMIERARVDIDPLLPRFKECFDEDVWPGYPEEAQAANLTKFGWEISNE